tara:strand:+ start:733 stop:1551 length:819 start_codon:yes stop_codon:yes gene_type:complete
MIKIKELYVYPIKSLKGISIKQAEISETGIKYDRYWMLVDQHGDFITQREIPKLALFQVSIHNEHLTVRFESKEINIPKALVTEELKACEIWEEKLNGYKESDEINNWFSSILDKKVFLVRNAELPKRSIKHYEDSFVNFTDSQQYLIFGQSSLDNLNAKIDPPIHADRFRPNIVFSKSDAHFEDSWKEIQIGASNFIITKACGRCVITTINQKTGLVGKEPLKTLAKYRFIDNHVIFGMYLKLINSADNLLKIGDEITMISENEHSTMHMK